MNPLVLPSLEATQSLAIKLAEQAFPGTILLLQGDLGAGKTTFVQGLGLGLGVHEPINSPTFVLMQEYEGGRLPLVHCDFYRLDPAAVGDLGLDELWTTRGITAIEWPERLPYLPTNWLKLHFEILDTDERRITATCQGADHSELWQSLIHSQALKSIS